MTAYRVEIDGAVVWSNTDDADTPDLMKIPAEYLSRPAETPEGDPHLAAHVLFINDECVGVQVSAGEEADRLTAEATEADAAGQKVLAAQLRAVIAQSAVLTALTAEEA